MIWVECSSFLKCCHEVAINCPLQDKSLGWCIKYDQTKSSWNNHQENFLRGEKRHQLGYIVLWWVWAFPGWWRRSGSLAFYLPLWQSSLLPFSCPRHPLKCFLPTKMISYADTYTTILPMSNTCQCVRWVVFSFCQSILMFKNPLRISIFRAR